MHASYLYFTVMTNIVMSFTVYQDLFEEINYQIFHDKKKTTKDKQQLQNSTQTTHGFEPKTCGHFLFS